MTRTQILLIALLLAPLAALHAADIELSETLQLPGCHSLGWVRANTQALDQRTWDGVLDEAKWGTPSPQQAVIRNWELKLSDAQWAEAVKQKGEGKKEDVKFELWLPQGVDAVKGIVVMSGHGSGTGLFRRPDMRALARELRLALFMFNGNPMQRGFWPHSLLFDRLKAFGAKSGHPELEHAPLFLYGHSNGTGFSAIFTATESDRVWGWISMRPGITFQVYQPGAAQVPGLVIFGEIDDFFGRPSREENIAVVPALRKKTHALWNIAVEPKTSHGPGEKTWPLVFSFLRHSFAARVPADADARKGPVKLNTLTVESGYLGQNWDVAKGGYQELSVAPFAEFAGDKTSASWLLNAAYAADWRQFQREETVGKPQAAVCPPLRFILDMVHHNPGEKPFDTKFTDPAVVKQWGYNGQVIKTFPQTALTYDSFDPAVVPAGSPERAWAETYGKVVDERIAAAKACGQPVFNFTDMLVVPEKLLLKYADDMTVGTGAITKEIIEKNRQTAIHGSMHGTSRRFSILRPMTQKVVRAQLDELFARFPDLAGIFVRFGETYLQDTPYHVGGSPVGGGVEEHQALIQLLREEVCVKRNKLVFYRTWGWDGFLTDTNFYCRVTDGIAPHPNLIFSIKHSNGDFTRDVPFNKTLGIGNHPQLVEVSCNQAGLYGKNAWPYYIGQGVIDGWETDGLTKRGLRSLVGNKTIAGVWTWTRGDGWAGPYTPNEFWVDLNAYVINRFGQQPSRAEKEIFDEYCRDKLKLDETQTAKLRELCLLATLATYHGQESSLFKSNSWWCRDEYLTALNLQSVVERGLVEKVLEEKAKAVADWKRVEQMAREIKLTNAADQEFLSVSCTYGRIKMAITEQIWTLQILDAQSKTSGALDKEKMRQALQSYDALWAEWRKLKQDHSCCPTLYRDDTAVHCGPPFQTALNRYRKIVN